MKRDIIKPAWHHLKFGLLILGAFLMISGLGCATRNERSYNQDFGQSLPSAPEYAIKDIDDNHFKIILHQGAPEDGPGRISDMKAAAPVIAETNAKQRGWPAWQINYIQERDQGWMHILIAEVTRKNATEESPDRSTPGS